MTVLCVTKSQNEKKCGFINPHPLLPHNPASGCEMSRANIKCYFKEAPQLQKIFRVMNPSIPIRKKNGRAYSPAELTIATQNILDLITAVHHICSAIVKGVFISHFIVELRIVGEGI